MPGSHGIERGHQGGKEKLGSLAEQRAATETEGHRRIASYLHDSVIQSLSLSNIRLGALRASVGKGCPDDQRGMIDGIRALVEEAIRECRELINELAGRRLCETGLVSSLRDSARILQELHGVAIVVDEAAFPEPTEETLRDLLFEGSRELITNAAKHAAASEIRVTLSRGKGDIRVQVRDNGEGFDVASIKAAARGRNHGFGLFNVRERAEYLGGRLDIQSTRGKGTAVTIIVPVPDTASDGHGPEDGSVSGTKGL